MVSVSETSTMPTAAAASVARSLALVQGIEGVGSPAGSVPTVFTPSAARSKTAETTVAATTATSTAGIFFADARQAEQQSEHAEADEERRRVGLVEAGEEGHDVVRRRSRASVEKPKSLGSWPTMIVMASPFM